MGIEQKVLLGLKTSVSDRTIPVFPDYSSEIKRYKPRKKKGLPFENQENAFMELLRSLSTKYPYAVLVGDSGIGKSMMLDYFLSVMTNDDRHNEMKTVIPEAYDLVTNLRKRVSDFQHIEHLLLPNFYDPSHVVCISYQDYKLADLDVETADDFCDELAGLLGNFGSKRRDDIRKSMTEKQLRKYAKSLVDDFIIEVYSETRERIVTSPATDGKEMINELFGLTKDKFTYTIDMELPEKFDKDSEIKRSIRFVSDDADYKMFRQNAGFNEAKMTITRSNVEEGIKDTILDAIVEKRYGELIYDLMHIDIDDKTDTEKVFSIFREEFGKFPAAQLRSKVESGKFRTQAAVVDYLESEALNYSVSSKVSEVTVDLLRKKIDGIREEYSSIKTMNPELHNWMCSVCDYLTKDKSVLKNALSLIMDEIEEQEYEERPKYSNKPHDKKDDKKGKDNKPPKSGFIPFKIEHGKNTYDIGDLLDVNFIADRAPTKISWTKVGDMSSEAFFASFNEPDEDMPPHMCLYDKGSFFSSGILVFNDSFSDFVKYIASDDNKKVGMRERFLEYLQTGKMTLVNEGITYQMYNPQIIIGCDNDDPFVRIEGILPVEETGLRGRIKLINAPSIARNTPENRKGTLRVLYNTIDQFNSSNQSKITVTPDAANILLAGMIPDEGFLNLKYREFSANLDDLCAYAVSKKVSEITADFIRQKKKDDLPVTFFYEIERESNFGGFFDLPEKNVGYANGLYVSQHNTSGRVKVKSYPSIRRNLEKDDIFELVDITSKMTDENTIKGYDLAKDYLISLLGKDGYRAFRDSEVLVKTEFDESWQGIGGPSASMAITSSMFSVMSGKEIYKNRFMTGTIDPHNGAAGMIGGTYYKGLVPMRLKEISKDDSEMYFLFPAGNLKDLTQDMIFDPFSLENKVNCIPILNFPQAFYLLTCGPKISEDDWKKSEEYGKDMLSGLLKKIKAPVVS